MKLVIQRVTHAKVLIAQTGETVGEIKEGLFCLVGLGEGDTDIQVRQIASKLLKLRIMSDDTGKMNRSIIESGGSILVVSQFTLYANTRGGNRPSFIESMEQTQARELYALFIDILYESNIKVATGSFGDYMKIDCSLDGPVTIILES